MSVSRLAAWIFFAAVCGAWLASAAGVSRYAATREAPRLTPIDVTLNQLAADVQTQAGRLRDRLSTAPSPTVQQRNPFQFSQAPPAARAATPAPAPIVPAAEEIREPSLTLIGIAERHRPAGPMRTAMITVGSDQLLMVTQGQTLLDRYEVVAVSVDVVELKDRQTSAIRRLVLR